MIAALVTGINTELPGVDPFVVDGQTIVRATLLARIQAALDAISAVQAARTSLQSAIAAQKAAIKDARGLRAGIKRIAQTKFGPSSPTLQKLGFTPLRTPVTPVAAKAQAQAKRTATRAAKKPAPPPVATPPVATAPAKS